MIYQKKEGMFNVVFAMKHGFRPHMKKSKLSPKKSTHYFAYLFLLFLISLSFVGIMETFREDILYNFPELDMYYKFIENIIESMFKELKYLFNSFSV